MSEKAPLLELSAEELDCFFPSFIAVDGKGVITSYGSSVRHHAGANLEGRNFLDEFRIVRPDGVMDIAAFGALGSGVVLEYKRAPELKLRGAVLERNGDFMFLTGHAPILVDHGAKVRYRYADFSPCDGAQDLFLAAQMRKALLEDAHVLADQLKYEKVAAEAANVAKSNFLACMSHEIRTPLNGVLGMATVLSRMGLTSDQREVLKVIEDSGETLLRLLNDVLDLSKIENGHLDIVQSEFVLADLVTSIDTIYRMKCEEKGLKFDIVVEPSLRAREYLGDVDRIRQILNNLVSNAVKFTEKGGVSVAIREKAHSFYGVLALEFKVTDTGIGIDAASLKKLFAPFVQADSSITRRYGGTGLGLSISKRICQKMGGSITVDSRPGHGSTFTMVIPVEAAASASAA